MSERKAVSGVDSVTDAPETYENFKQRLSKIGVDKTELLRLFLISAGGETPEGNKNHAQHQELHTARREIFNQLRMTVSNDPIERAIIQNLSNAKLFKLDVVKTTGYVLRAEALCTIFPAPQYLTDLCIQFCLHSPLVPATTGYPIATHLAGAQKRTLDANELRIFLLRLIQEVSPESIPLAADIQKILSTR